MVNIEKIFQKEGKKYGLDVTASVVPFREMKVTWLKYGTQIDFQICDYLKGIDKETAEELAVTMFDRCVMHEPTPYGSKLLAHINSDEFLAKNRPKYLDRADGFNPRTTHVDLNAIYEELIAEGLLSRLDGLQLGWGRTEDKVGRASTLFKTAIINQRLNSPLISHDVLKVAVWSQVVFIQPTLSADPSITFKEWKDAIEDYEDQDAVRTLNEYGLRFYDQAQIYE